MDHDILTAQGRLTLRTALRLSRSELAKFVGVSMVTVVRWEASDAYSVHGLVGLILSALRDAIASRGIGPVRAVVIRASYDHRRALKDLLDMAGDERDLATAPRSRVASPATR